MSHSISSPFSTNRRRFLMGAAALSTGASALRFPTPAIAQGAPLKVGFMLPYSGTFAKLGKFVDDGFRLYVERQGGSLGGRRIEFVQVDDESKPESATDNMNRLVGREKVDLVVGTVHSGVAMAMVKVARDTSTPLIIPNAGVNEATGPMCAPHIFRTSFSNWQVCQPMGKVMFDEGRRRVVTITWRYAAGSQMIDAFKEGFMLGFMTPEAAGASIWLVLPAALVVVAALAAVIGVLSLRTRGIYFIMVTLAFGEMLFYLFHDTKIGGGSDGLYIYFKPELVIGGVTLLDLENPRAFYWTELACLASAALLVRALVRSPFGHALAAARDNERRALSLGFPVFRIRLTAFVISAMIAAVAGFFSAAQFGFVAPQMLGWHLSASVLVMVVLGGMSSILGPIVGAIALLGLEEVLKSSFEHWKLIKGLIVIALVFALPGGLQQLMAMLAPPQAAEDRDAKAPATPKEAASHV